MTVVATLVFLSMFAVVLAARSGAVALAALHASLLVACNVLTAKVVVVMGWSLTLGTPLYGSTFLITDLVAERCGKSSATRIVMVGFAVLLAFNALLALALAVDSVDQAKHFDQALSFTPRVFVASLITYIVAQHLDVWIFQRLRDLTSGSFPWFRNIGSTSVSQAIDSLCFFFLAFYNTEFDWVELAVSGYIVKLVVSLLDTPFFYWGRRVARISEADFVLGGTGGPS